ncbi:MAG: hypothetical protein JO179_10540, partial [Solirubrobacterales bacterium]|nr:hypothetical protein [Solirubrobacterales bacterium]
MSHPAPALPWPVLMEIARVMPLATTRAVRGPFDYKLKPEHAGVEVGSLVR